jgi:hypothetical protein
MIRRNTHVFNDCYAPGWPFLLHLYSHPHEPYRHYELKKDGEFPIFGGYPIAVGEDFPGVLNAVKADIKLLYSSTF